MMLACLVAIAVLTNLPLCHGVGTPCPTGRYSPSGYHDTHNAATECAACALGTLCVDRKHRAVDVGAVQEIPCAQPARCGAGVCAEGFEGEQCAACKPAFFLEKDRCVACPAVPYGTILYFSCVFVASVGLFILVDIGQWQKMASVEALVSFTQNLMILSLVTTHWPEAYAWAWTILSKFTRLIDLDATGPECYLGSVSWDARFGLTLGAYAGVALLLGAAIACIRRRTRLQLASVERKIKAAERKALSTAAYARSPVAAAGPEGTPIDDCEQALIDLKLRRELVLDEKWEDKFTRVAVLFATARRSSAEHLIANESAALHSYGLDSHSR